MEGGAMEEGQQGYHHEVTGRLTDAPTYLELRLEERVRELMASAAGRAGVREVFTMLLKLAEAPASDRQVPCVRFTDDDRLFIVEAKGPRERACKRLWRAAWGLRLAKTTIERRDAVREFLAALAELTAQLLRMLARVLLVLLSRLLGRATADDVPVWKPVPIESTPQIAPRGPNSAFPVSNHRGGHHRSTLGSVVLAA